jgi:hypothetical protein
MAFIVEDGTGVSNANSLVSVEFADSYFSDRGNRTWAGTTEEKQAALVRATDYFETRYSNALLSSKTDADQALSFPRVDYTLVPAKILKGVSEYAVRALSAALLPDPVSLDSSGRTVKRIRKGLGPLAKDIEYADSSSVKIIKPYPQADSFFSEFIRRSNRVVH